VRVLTDVVVVDPVSVVETGQLLVEGAVGAKLFGEMAGGDVRCELAEFPEQGLLDQECFILLEPARDDANDGFESLLPNGLDSFRFG